MKKSELLEFGITKTFLGHVLIAKSNKGIAALLIGSRPDELEKELQLRFPYAKLSLLANPPEKVISFLDNLSAKFDMPLDERGTVFQKKVWKALRAIPYGSTTNYAELAKYIGSPKAVRAVANACGANPIAVITPCHRVIRKDGSISGYRWGVEIKKILLEKENN